MNEVNTLNSSTSRVGIVNSAYSEKNRCPYDGLRPWSAITHGIGIVLSVTALIFLMSFASHQGLSMVSSIALAIYGVAMTALYTASTLYHSLNTGVKGRIRLRKADHMMIYFLIAGTYTPVCVICLPNVLGYTLLGIIWSLALIGCIINIKWIKLPRWLTSSIYIIMGWIAIVAVYPLSKVFATGVLWLVFGGFFYTVGGILYATKWPGKNNPRFGCHEIFHVFILLGSICHFVMVFLAAGIGV